MLKKRREAVRFCLPVAHFGPARGHQYAVSKHPIHLLDETVSYRRKIYTSGTKTSNSSSAEIYCEIEHCRRNRVIGCGLCAAVSQNQRNHRIVTSVIES
jgi:hypothetical protein